MCVCVVDLYRCNLKKVSLLGSYATGRCVLESAVDGTAKVEWQFVAMQCSLLALLCWVVETIE